MIIKQQNFDQLIDNVYQTHYVLQENTRKVINRNLTIRNWLVGYYIVEFEQNGEDRAKYGTNLIGELASKLKAKGLKGFSISALKNHRAFYMLYPQIGQSVIGFLKNEKSQSLTGELKTLENESVKLISSKDKEQTIEPELLLSKLSYTHFIELIKFDDPLERFFYEVETIKNNWSVRELERAINTALYVRTGLSQNKDAIISKFKNQKPAQSVGIIRDPYFLEIKAFIISLIFIILFISPLLGQEGTYWKIKSVYSENGKSVSTGTYALMKSIFEDNPHFIKCSDTLYLGYPEEKIILIDTLKSFSGKRFDESFSEKYRGLLYDSICYAGIENGHFKIKYIENPTFSDNDKKIAVEFKELTKEEYETSIVRADSIRKDQYKQIEMCIDSFKAQVSWEMHTPKMWKQNFKTFNKHYKIELPEEYNVRYQGSWYINTFDDLKIGLRSDSKNGQYYAIERINNKSSINDPMLIFSKDSKDSFDYTRYINNEFNDKNNIVFQSGNSIVYLEAAYDIDEKKAKIKRVRIFKYFYVKNTHIIFDSSVPVRNNDYSLMYEHFRIMSNLEIK